MLKSVDSGARLALDACTCVQDVEMSIIKTLLRRLEYPLLYTPPVGIRNPDKSSSSFVDYPGLANKNVLRIEEIQCFRPLRT